MPSLKCTARACAEAHWRLRRFPISSPIFETTDPTRPEDRRAEYGDERIPEMREFLMRISPVTNASKLGIPLFIVHGANDTRVPPGQAEEMARLVRANNVPVWMTIYADEGHDVWAKPANNNFWFYTWIDVREAISAELSRRQC